ncbi:hypothetical protein Q3G72_023959 [Acer saccharum]|nr:hypothetical protein Q3G72_023959 [Acer saccharum]
MILLESRCYIQHIESSPIGTWKGQVDNNHAPPAPGSDALPACSLSAFEMGVFVVHKALLKSAKSSANANSTVYTNLAKMPAYRQQIDDDDAICKLA